MQINPQALERLKAAPLSGPGLANIFQQMVAVVKEAGPDCSAALNLDYQDKNDPIQEGDLIPVISISLRPATVLKQTIEQVVSKPPA